MDNPVAQIRTEAGGLKALACAMRKEPTPAEAVVWKLLRGRTLGGLRFRRQHVLHGHIVDFYCHERRFCLELDGAPHLKAEQWTKDKERDADLTLRGYVIVPMMNEDVLRDLPGFRLRILEAASSTASPTSSPMSSVPPL